jgi:carbohydrate-binding DOMON domain-containing protein
MKNAAVGFDVLTTCKPQYRLVQSGKTASGGCSAGQGSSEPVAPRIYLLKHCIVMEALAFRVSNKMQAC